MPQSFYPFDDRVVILPDATQEKTSGGIYMPETVKEDEEHRTGVVRFVGPGKYEQGTHVPMLSKVGMRVRYYKFRAVPITVGNEECVVVTETDVIGCLGEE